MSIETRRAGAGDLHAVLALARRSLGWTDVSPRFLEWKHLENPFGPSFMWITIADDRVVGFRAFLRWELLRPDGTTVRAARAVDTATDPDYRRRGLFRAMTVNALDELTADGVTLVWNTPNASSLPGYLSMGWHEVGRLPVAFLPASARCPLVMLTARRAARRDAVATPFGTAAWEVFGRDPGVDRLLDALPREHGLATKRSQALLAWRYNNPALGYRLLFAGARAESGFAVFRLRRRGRAVEAVVCETLVPRGDHDARADRTTGDLLRRIRRETPADYLVRINRPGVTRRPFVRLPGSGPVLACRPLDGSRPPGPGEWSLTMGDVELL